MTTRTQITYENLFEAQFHCLPSQGHSLDNYPKEDLIEFIQRLKQAIETLNKTDHHDFGLAIVATNSDDLEKFENFALQNFLPICKTNCHVSDVLTQSMIDDYLSTGIDSHHLEYAMIILLDNVKYDQITSFNIPQRISIDNRTYSYSLQILCKDSLRQNNEEFLTKIRFALLGEQFVDNHHDHASVPTFPTSRQPQFVSISPWSSIACWPLPRRRDLSRFRDDLRLTHVLTLLNDEEVKKTTICQQIQSVGMTSIHLPIEGADLSVFTSPTTFNRLNEQIPSIVNLLRNSNECQPVKMLIHCAAGLHRTGAITYLLLRLCQFTVDQSMLIIHRTRSITGRQVAQKRIDIVESDLLSKFKLTLNLLDQEKSHEV